MSDEKSKTPIKSVKIVRPNPRKEAIRKWEEEYSQRFPHTLERMYDIALAAFNGNCARLISIDHDYKDRNEFEDSLKSALKRSLESFIFHRSGEYKEEYNREKDKWTNINRKLHNCIRNLRTINKMETIQIDLHLIKNNIPEIEDDIMESLYQARYFANNKLRSLTIKGKGRKSFTYFVISLFNNLERLLENSFPRNWNTDSVNDAGRKVKIFSSPSSQLIFDLVKVPFPDSEIGQVKGILNKLPSKSSQIPR